MLTQRSEGLRRLLLICQIWLTVGLFWLAVWLMVTFYSPSGHLTWRRYSIYCVLLVLGLTFEYLGRDSSRDYPLRKGVLALIEDTDEQNSAQKTDYLNNHLNGNKAADDATAADQSL